MSVASSELSVAVCQLTSVDDVAVNCEKILKLLNGLESDAPDLVCFPENSLYFRMREGATIPAIESDDEAIRTISSWAQKTGAVVHLGSVPIRREGRMYISSLVLWPDGSVHDDYRKIHLFDVDVDGVKPVRESDTYAHGTEPFVFTVKGWKFGATICYDLRFSELFLRYAKLEVDAILIPSSFLVPTGRAHWDVLTRARAIECQAYVLAAAQGEHHHGVAGGTRDTYGHSMIIDPWGVVVATVPGGFRDDQRVLRSRLNRERIEKVRAQIPMKNHRRLV